LDVDFTDTSTNTPTSWTWDFDDTGTSTLRNPSHTYASGGTYNVCLTAANAGGSDSACQDVTVTKPPTAEFDFSVDGQDAAFTDTSTDTPTSWSWDFDDGNSSTSQNPSHTFASGGTYNVCLTATNAGGSDPQCRSVTVYGIPTAAFTFGTTGLTANFTDTSASTPTSWLWDFGDGAEVTSTEQNPSHTYANSGTYTVCLTATNGSGSSTTVCQNVTVIRPPSANFTLVAHGLTVDFTDTSTESPTNWTWTFSDGGLGSTQNPSHTFANTATYTACLIATNAGGSSGQICKELMVTKPPTAAFIFVVAGMDVEFTDTSTGGPTGWLWNFGDTGTSTSQNASHSYASAGTYNVCLTASNANGTGSTQNCQDVTIDPAPTTSFTFSVDTLSVNFTDTSTDNPTSWLWDFGDSNSSTEQSHSHSFAVVGSYTVCLTATNLSGSNQSCQTISVNAGAPQLVSPTATITDPSPTFEWNGPVATTRYRVYIRNTSGLVLDQWYEVGNSDVACTGGNCTFSYTLPLNSDYTWYVFGQGPFGYTLWSEAGNFTLEVPAPSVINKTAPADSSIFGSILVSFAWDVDANAAWYQISLKKGTNATTYQWFEATDICTTTCTTDLTVSVGEYAWDVRGYGLGGHGSWGTEEVFSVVIPVPDAVTKTAPIGTISTATPTFTWVHDAAATQYQVWIGKAGSPVYYQTQDASVVCDAGNCSLDTGLTFTGAYTWYVRGMSAGGSGNWGTEEVFSVVIPVPSAITKTAPIGTINTASPTFTWVHDAVATEYEVWVGNTNGALYQQWQDASVLCDAGNCSLDTGLTLVGDYTWYVRGRSAGGSGSWGTEAAFSYTIALHSPTGTVNGTNITYNWDDLDVTTAWYRIWAGPAGGTPILDLWVQGNTICNGATCSYTHITTVAAGNYVWYIQPHIPGIGNEAWSAGQNFTVGVAPRQEVLASGTIESNDPSVASTGVWQGQNTASASGGSYLYSSGDENDVLIVEFYGTSVEIVYVTHPSFGSFAIDIDNNIHRTVVTTTDEATFDNRAVVNYLDDGYHTLRIYSVDGIIAIDALVIE
jgi:PKD repeat protein